MTRNRNHRSEPYHRVSSKHCGICLLMYVSAVIAILFNFSLFAQTVSLDSGLVAYWNFDENTGEDVHDVTGNGLDGYLVGDVDWVSGKFGSALEFLGTNSSHVEVPESVLGEALIFTPTDNWSISMWVKLPVIPTPGWYAVVAKSRDKGAHYGMWLGSNGGLFWVFCGWPNWGSEITEDYQDVWTHLVAMQDGNSGVCMGYLDGSDDYYGELPRDSTGVGDLWIGGAKSVNEWLVGIVDDVRIYNRALSSQEVTALYQYTPSTAVKDRSMGIENNLLLNQNYPNPFNPTTNISFDLPKKSEVNITVYDVLGHEVVTLVNEIKFTGRHIVQFDGKNLKSGVYICRMDMDNQVFTRKMILLK